MRRFRVLHRGRPHRARRRHAGIRGTGNENSREKFLSYARSQHQALDAIELPFETDR